jgi:hypothetical protein
MALKLSVRPAHGPFLCLTHCSLAHGYESKFLVKDATAVFSGEEQLVENPLSKLALDYWYQVLMVVSIVVFLLSAAGVLKALPTVPTLLISFGGFWIGLGEWVNHPLQTKVYPGNAYYPGLIGTGHPRSPNAIGNLFLFLGFVLVAAGIYKFFR